MLVVDYLVDFLIKNGVTDVFGLPGGVVLEFLYALDRRHRDISVHLNCHEQCAGFAAAGYAQATGRLGVAYATRGPGVTNLITPVADAFYDSIPVLFLTAHSIPFVSGASRCEADQEFDTVAQFTGITQYAARVEKAADMPIALQAAYTAALRGRRGPAFLDIGSWLWREKLPPDITETPLINISLPSYESTSICERILTEIHKAKRPVFLLGNGLRFSAAVPAIRLIAERAGIPIISSAISQDILGDSPMYFGYIGSHGTRYGNFLLAKSDLILAVGNRIAYPAHSRSFCPMMERKRTIWIDLDQGELSREIPNCLKVLADGYTIFSHLANKDCSYPGRENWLTVCCRLREELWREDVTEPVEAVAELLQRVQEGTVCIADVGNNAVWLARAIAYTGSKISVYYSHSFGSLGCSLAKSIGAYYSIKKSIICIVGDQGMQLNLQELQIIAQHKLPVGIVVLNNQSSGMIRDAENRKFNGHFVHTTPDSGYQCLNLAKIAEAYGLTYCNFNDEQVEALELVSHLDSPCLIEVKLDTALPLTPCLPAGNPCQDLFPALSRQRYENLDRL